MSKTKKILAALVCLCLGFQQSFGFEIGKEGSSSKRETLEIETQKTKKEEKFSDHYGPKTYAENQFFEIQEKISYPLSRRFFEKEKLKSKISSEYSRLVNFNFLDGDTKELKQRVDPNLDYRKLAIFSESRKNLSEKNLEKFQDERLLRAQIYKKKLETNGVESFVFLELEELSKTGKLFSMEIFELRNFLKEKFFYLSEREKEKIIFSKKFKEEKLKYLESAALESYRLALSACENSDGKLLCKNLLQTEAEKLAQNLHSSAKLNGKNERNFLNESLENFFEQLSQSEKNYLCKGLENCQNTVNQKILSKILESKKGKLVVENQNPKIDQILNFYLLGVFELFYYENIGKLNRNFEENGELGELLTQIWPEGVKQEKFGKDQTLEKIKILNSKKEKQVEEKVEKIFSMEKNKKTASEIFLENGTERSFVFKNWKFEFNLEEFSDRVSTST